MVVVLICGALIGQVTLLAPIMWVVITLPAKGQSRVLKRLQSSSAKLQKRDFHQHRFGNGGVGGWAGVNVIVKSVCIVLSVQVNLGNMYYSGLGVPKDWQRAKELYRAASDADQNAKLLLEELELEEQQQKKNNDERKS